MRLPEEDGGKTGSWRVPRDVCEVWLCASRHKHLVEPVLHQLSHATEARNLLEVAGCQVEVAHHQLRPAVSVRGALGECARLDRLRKHLPAHLRRPVPLQRNSAAWEREHCTSAADR
eukprot:scaffold182030_cov28-Tisochrysis_lutea.AAC.3